MDQRREIKEAIELILGSKIVMNEVDEVGNEDELKKEFIKVVTEFEEIWRRQNDLDLKYGVDFTTYDEPFFRVIEGWIRFCFDDIAGEAILFYIYGRKGDKDIIIPFEEPSGKQHFFNTIDDLWEFLMYWAEEMMKP